MSKGEIALSRKDGSFRAGFCIMNKSLADISKDSWQLHPDETSYYETLKYDKRKVSYLLGRITAKTAVRELLRQDIVLQSFSVVSGVFQFPVVRHIPTHNVQVSISHCDNLGIALAFPEEHPLAVDIERIDEDKIITMKSIICVGEVEKVSECALTEATEATVLWTIKEALSKILKTGLTVNFELLEIEFIQREGAILTGIFKHFSQYRSISLVVGEHVCSIVLPKNTYTDVEAIREGLEKSLSTSGPW